MTRHDLKEQLQHDQFTDAVSGVVSYTSSHRQLLIRWAAIVVVVLVLAGGLFWYRNYQRSIRRQDLAAAMTVLDAQVGPASEFAKSYPTEEAHQQASMKALADMVAKHGGTNEGLIAQYYLGTLKAKTGQAGAENDLRTVANSSAPVAPLAKIALAQLYLGEKKTVEAQGLLRSIVNSPGDLVSKAQAQILLAQADVTVNPQESRRLLRSIDQADQKRPAVTHAADQVSAQLK